MDGPLVDTGQRIITAVNKEHRKTVYKRNNTGSRDHHRPSANQKVDHKPSSKQNRPTKEIYGENENKTKHHRKR